MFAHISFFGHLHAQDIAGLGVIALCVFCLIWAGKGKVE